MLISKTLQEIIDEVQGQEVIDIMLNMNEKYNMYNGKNFSWEYDITDRQFYLVDEDGNELMAGITTDIVFPDIFINFICMADDTYIAVCDQEFPPIE